MMFRIGKILTALSLSLFLLVTACAAPSTAPPPSTEAPQTSTQQPTQVSGEPLAGGQFNQFFPNASGDYKRVFAQEKTGFAEAKLKQDGKDVAVLSINDLANNPSAAKKFQDSSKTIAGYPAVERGKTQTAILVRDRFQVKVQSRDDSFTPGDREAWLEQFDLQGLSQLK
ncbi:hypothetical protein [Coleofasciculus sp. C1-SOL-03]|uniref:hypothetical protein n=1 Tax=Coleofasciculus sp. C1-SOL-03 TaxID=3069522 RepID=UPI004062AFB5